MDVVQPDLTVRRQDSHAVKLVTPIAEPVGASGSDRWSRLQVPAPSCSVSTPAKRERIGVPDGLVERSGVWRRHLLKHDQVRLMLPDQADEE